MWKTVFERKQMKRFYPEIKKKAKKKNRLGLKKKKVDWSEGLQMLSCLKSSF